MSRKTSRCLAISIAVLAVLAGPATVRAAGTEPFDVTFPLSETGLVDDCFGATGGVLEGTGHEFGRVVSVGGNAVIQGREVDEGIITFSDGSTAVIASRDQFSLVDRTSGDGVFVNTNAHVDTATSYDANGNVLGTTTFRLVEHITIAGGVVRVEFVRGRLTCG
jgi:hypothetical protein